MSPEYKLVGGAPNPDPYGGERVCPKCGEEIRLTYIGFDPPEPYGDVCGCSDEALAQARGDKAASDADAVAELIHGRPAQ